MRVRIASAGPLIATLAVAAPAVAVARRAVPAMPGRQAYLCASTSFTLFDNTNTADTQGGGTAPSFDTQGRTYCLDSISTSHENAPPGTIGLTRNVGPFPAAGDPETWTATPPGPVLIHGRYGCVDSDPATWSQNATTGGRGFCVVTVSAVTRTRQPHQAKPTWVCNGSPLTLFDNSNGFAINDGGKRPIFNTWVNQGVSAYCLGSIRTYHWNGGHGQKPGKLGLRPASFTALFNRVPPRHAKGSAGQNNAPNVNWEVDYPSSPPTIISGAYFCDDSSPATWSSNPFSHDDGFCTVSATPAYLSGYTLPSGTHIPTPVPPSGQPAQPKPTGQVRCFTGTLSTMLLYPHTIKSGDPDMILLQCGVKKADGFQGRLSPSAVFAISVGCAGFWTYPSPFGTPPPPAFVTYTGPQNSGCSNDQHFLPYTVHGPWRVDISAYDRNAQAPLRPGTYAVYLRYAGGDPQAQNTLVVQ